MESLVEQASRQDEGTSVRRFLARRGAVVIKETRDIAEVFGLYRDHLAVSTMVLAVVKGSHRDMSYGVRLERKDEDNDTNASVFLDYDEIHELIDAFDFIRTSAGEMAPTKRDYTEVTYSTKDNARIGFFQSSDRQQVFVTLEPHRDTTFLADEEFQRLKMVLLQAKSHLESKGASVA